MLSDWVGAIFFPIILQLAWSVVGRRDVLLYFPSPAGFWVANVLCCPCFLVKYDDDVQRQPSILCRSSTQLSFATSSVHFLLAQKGACINDGFMRHCTCTSVVVSSGCLQKELARDCIECLHWLIGMLEDKVHTFPLHIV